MDAGDFDGVGELFADDGALLDPDGGVIAQGRRGIAEIYGRIVLLHDGSPRTTHVTANPIIRVEHSGAFVRSTYVVFQGVDGRPQTIATGRYDDRLMKVDDAWRFVERRFTIEQEGDLSRHLRMAQNREDHDG